MPSIYIRLSCAVLYLLVVANALAIPVTYQFTTGSAGYSSNSDLVSALGGFSVSGKLVYDSDAPVVFTAPDGATVHPAVTDFSASVGGFTISDPTGAAAVGNDTFTPAFPVPQFILDQLPPNPFPSDFLQLALNLPGPGSDFVGFALAGLELLNVRMFWLENWAPFTTPDFLDAAGLPDPLPTLVGRLALDFGVNDVVDYANTVFFDGLQVSQVSAPEPATLSLLGIGLLGFAVAKRKRLR